MIQLRRHGTLIRALVLALIASLVITVPVTRAKAHPGHGDETFNALIFSKTAGFRHDSIPAGIQAIRDLAAEHGFTVTATEDASMFNDAELAKYEVVIWLSTTGDVLNADQQAAFERYIRGGGGYAGIHAASDTEYSWPWYGKLVGSYFASHPPGTPNATVKVEDHAHPSTKDAPTLWPRTDEWYNYQTNPRDSLHVLASLDESTYSGGTMGVEHPIAWCQDYEGGRAWYTGMGHTIQSYSEPAFRQHLLGGIRTAAGVEPADCGASLSDSYQKVTLDDNTSNPMELAIAQDGRVFYIDRNGAVKVVKTDGSVVTAGTLSVYTGQEFGLLGIALDPGFAQNGFVYLYYSPAGNEAFDRVSRFTLNGDTLDLASEKQVLRIDTQRAQCCHAGGALEFDGQGNLYIATGDNTNPFDSDGYTPIDERAGRAPWDAQRSAANSNNLNGKILRIHPEPDGTYTVPAGNMFTPGTARTRPEIFAMGFRNPFRIGIDPATNHLFVADYGPDAGQVSPTRGPDGRVEWNIVDKPGFHGWPYCVGNNTPYNDHDFATGTSGAPFNCAAPVNNSPNNTGITQLPAAIPASLWMGKSTSGVPEIGGSGAPMTSGAYKYDPANTSDRKWPAYFDGKAVFADWNDSRLFSVQLTPDRTKVADVTRMLQKLSFVRPHALQFGPDGALYVIEWGSGFGGNNTDSGVYRIDYVQGNRAPIAQFKPDKTSGPAPLTVKFDSTGSRDPDGQPITYAWDFDGNGTTDSTAQHPTHTYTQPGVFTVRLTVTDSDGRSAVSNQTITSGNTAPTVTIEAPVEGGYFDFGDTIRYKVSVTDPEDGTVDCDDIITQPALGHDEHPHPYEQYRGCTGTFPLPGDAGHVGANIFGLVNVKYTDKGAPGSAPITTEKVIVLQPKTREAEYFDETGGPGSTPGVQVENTGDTAGGGKNIGWIEDGDWWSWNPTNLTGIDQLQLRAASPEAGATVQVRTGSPTTGPVLGTIQVSPTGAWQTYGNFTGSISASAVTGPLYFVKTTGQLNVNWVKFIGKGITENQRPSVNVTGSVAQGKAPLEVDFTATATDPEGDVPLSYSWSFGDGGTATGPAVSHTYTTAGTYTATATVTDSRGAAGTATYSVKVDSAAPPTCLTGRSDGFDGDALSTSRWSQVVRGNQELSVGDGSLRIPLTATDIYGTGNTDTPNIVLQPLPSGPWQATTKLTMPARLAYQQAGLIVYGDDDNYAKMVLQGRSTGGPSAEARIFQFVREEAGAPNEVAASNTANLGAAYPDTVWVRFTSDGSNLKAAYSSDGATFTEMPETKSLAGISNPRIGLFGLTNRAEALPLTASFDYFTLTPDDTAQPSAPDDEFTGTGLDACRWSGIVRPDPAGYRIAGGALEIDTSKGDIYGSPHPVPPKNLMLQPAPEGDWTVETKVDGSAFDERYQQAGLMVYADDANYVKLDYLTTNAAGSPVTRALELRSEMGDVVGTPAPNAPAPTHGVWYLRLTKSGSTFTGSYSANGLNWTALAPVTNTALSSASFGVYAFGVDQVASKTAKFDYFRLVRDTTAPQVNLSLNPSAPTGEDGWWTDEVVATALATDESGGQVYLEQKVGDGQWSEYTTPIRLTADGTHQVSVRASDTAGNVSEATTVTVRLDRSGPAIDVNGLVAGGKLGVGSTLSVTAAVTDPVSGPAGPAVLTVDGEPLAGRLDGAALGLGGHELVARARDKAGNATVTKVPFTVVATYAEAAKLIDRYRAAGKVMPGIATAMKIQLALAERQQARGREHLAAVALDVFLVQARAVRDPASRALLIAVGQDLKRGL